MMAVGLSEDIKFVEKVMSDKLNDFKKTFPSEKQLWVNVPKENFDLLTEEGWSSVKLHVVQILGYRYVKVSLSEYSGFTQEDWIDKVLNGTHN